MQVLSGKEWEGTGVRQMFLHPPQSGPWVLVRFPIPCRHGCSVPPQAPGSPPSLETRGKPTQAGKMLKPPPDFIKQGQGMGERAGMGVPAAGGAAAEGATAVTDMGAHRGQTPGK